MSAVDTNTLKWVKSEIDDTLKQAQTSLEAYVDDTADESQMRFCINYLHQIHGTLQMVELYGAALAIEEMEKLAQAIFDDAVNNKDDAYETLMRGILQVPDYLEHLLAGNPDMPVVLLPLLNDIRAARNENLLSEGALFTPDLSVNAPVLENVREDDIGLSELAGKIRHNFHLGLLSWFQNKNPKAGLQKIADVMSALTQAADSDEARRVFWIANGLVESLKDDGVEASVAVKMLLGQVDRQIKKIIDHGGFALDEAPPEDLEKNLLFYVASSKTAGSATQEIKEAFNLKNIMPDSQTVEQARADLTAPNAALMETVSLVILEDINRVKDSLDVFVRTDDKDMSVLEGVHASLKQMGDTLAMLNLGVQREAVMKQSEVIADIVAGKQDADEKTLMGVAAAMITVENSLSESSSAKSAAAIKVVEGLDAGDTALEQMKGAEQQKLMESVLDQAKINLAKIKEGLTEFSRNNDERDHLKPIPALLEQIEGSLMILSLPDSANLLALANNYIRNKLIKEKIPPSYDDMNNLADAISSLEYYMESLMGSWGQPDAILQVAEQSLQALGIDTTQTAEKVSDDDFAELNITEEQITSDAAAEVSGSPTEREPSSEDELSLDDFALELTDADAVADDFTLELTDTDSVTDDFTLELTDTDTGSDDFTLELTDADTESDDLTLELTGTDSALNDFETDGISLDGLSLADDGLDEGLSFDLEDSSLEEEVSAFNLEVESKPEEIAATPVAAQTPKNKEASLLDDTIDDEIIEIFIEEAEEAYESISQLLPVWVANTADDVSLKEIRRAYHTLKGSGRLVGAVELGEFAWAFENMLNRLLDNTIKASADLLELMELGKQALPKLFELFKTNSKAGQDILVLMQYADALSKGESISINAPATDEPVLTETAVEENTAVEEIPDFDTVEFEEEKNLPDVSETEELIADETVEAEEIIPIEVAEEPAIEVISEELPFPVDIDPTLLEIYRKEVATHTDALRIYISGWHSGTKGVSFVVLRALHTLTGSSRTTGVQSLAQVCSSFEHYIKHLQDTNGKVSKAAVDELENTILLIEETVKCLDVPGAELPDHKALLARVEALANDIPSETVTESESVSPAAPAEQVTTVAAEEPAVDLPMPDYDEELLEIFLEEGTEILDESDQTIHDWISNPQDDEYVKALQRQLHTLKGGARMAGISELGDLGHSIESLLTAVVDGHMKPSKRMFDLVQRSQDRLVKMLELVQSHKGLAAAKDLIREVDFMLENRGADEDMPLPEPEEEITMVAPAFTEEPEEGSLSVLNDALTLDDNDFSIPDETDIAATEELTFNIDEPYFDEEENLTEESNKLETEDSASTAEIEIPGLVDELVELESDLGKELDNVVELKQPQQEISIETVEEEVEEKPAAKTEEKLPAEDEGDRRKGPRVQAEQVRVRADLLDNLVNFAGEVSIYRSRLEQQTNNFRYNIAEFDETVNRLREQLRQFEIETEAQIEYRNEETLSNAQMDFDPLEMDRFTTMQHLSRAMMESLGDLDSLRGILNNLTRESETLLLQQSRVNTDLQEGLMRTRMVPFSGQAARLRRIVRQTCGELGKHAELDLTGIETELDRTVLERIIPPIEHMLRNAVAHGIESPEVRKKSGKPETGEIKFSIANEGSEIVIRIKDDGAGINLDAIREKAISRGLISADVPVSKDVLLDMIMQSGFSTAESVNQIAGRGVGMDVVNTEIKQLGGIFNINTAKDKGTTFTVSLPLTLAISRALMVMIGEDTYAVPLLSVEGVERISCAKIKEIVAQDNPVYNWVGEDYKFMHLGSVMGISEMRLADDKQQLPMLMIRSGESRAAILVDALLGSREIVVKSVGPQLSTLRGISGATVMGDGSVVLIIDLGMLIRLAATVDTTAETEIPVTNIAVQNEDTSTLVMVVDDSITVRKVTTRLLERHDMRVVSAKDGVDALAQLQEVTPDIMLLDVEMPRMDGFELATNMRNDERLQNVPIIMITSRTGQKHRDRAASIGVNIYMGKPFTETDLLNNINVLTGKDD